MLEKKPFPYRTVQMVIEKRGPRPQKGANLKDHAVYCLGMVAYGLGVLLLYVLAILYELLIPLLRLAIVVAVIAGVLDWFGVIHVRRYLPELPKWGRESQQVNVSAGEKPRNAPKAGAPASGENEKPGREVWPLALAAAGGAGATVIVMAAWRKARSGGRNRR